MVSCMFCQFQTMCIRKNYYNNIISFKYIIDQDECCVGTFCHVNASCSDSLGDFNCSCNDGFNGNGTDCESKYDMLNLFFKVKKFRSCDLAMPVTPAPCCLSLTQIFFVPVLEG